MTNEILLLTPFNQQVSCGLRAIQNMTIQYKASIERLYQPISFVSVYYLHRQISVNTLDINKI